MRSMARCERRHRLDPARQREALNALAATLEPSILDIPDQTLRLLTPSPFSDYDPIARREQFESDQYPAFSRANAAAAAGRITLDAMLNPARLARMEEQSARHQNGLAPAEVLERIEAVLFDAPRDETARLTPIRQALQAEYVGQLLSTAASSTPSAARLTRHRLTTLQSELSGRRALVRPDQAAALSAMISRGWPRLTRAARSRRQTRTSPPGSPIGADGCFHCDSGARLGLN